MENLQYTLNFTACTCPNQHLVSFGQTCDNCMGTVRQSENVLEEILPETKFDDKYFEELEAYYDGGLDIAA